MIKKLSWEMDFSKYAMKSLEAHWSAILAAFGLTFFIVAWVVMSSEFKTTEQFFILLLVLATLFVGVLLIWFVLGGIAQLFGRSVRIVFTQQGLEKHIMRNAKETHVDKASWKEIQSYHVHPHTNVITLQYRRRNVTKPHHLVVPKEHVSRVQQFLKQRFGIHKPTYL